MNSLKHAYSVKGSGWFEMTIHRHAVACQIVHVLFILVSLLSCTLNLHYVCAFHLLLEHLYMTQRDAALCYSIVNILVSLTCLWQ